MSKEVNADTLLVKALTDTATLPTRGTDYSAGLDLYLSEDVNLNPGESTLAGTGIAVAIPEGMVGLLYIRSGVAVKHGMSLKNSVGVIDSDYRNEVKVALVNNSDEPQFFATGERISQLVITPYVHLDPVFVDDSESLPETVRGMGGFGSTGMTKA